MKRTLVNGLCLALGAAALAGCAWEAPRERRGSIKDTAAPAPQRAAAPAEKNTVQEQTPRAGVAVALPDLEGCRDAASCDARVRAVVQNPDRSWIGSRQTPHPLPASVRVYAYITLRPILTCAELALAAEDLERVSKGATDGTPGFPKQKSANVTGLAAEVLTELRGEREKRCKPAPAPAAAPKADPPAGPAPAVPPAAAPPAKKSEPPPAPAVPPAGVPKAG